MLKKVIFQNLFGALYMIGVLSVLGILKEGKMEAIRTATVIENVSETDNPEQEEKAESAEKPMLALTFDDGPNPTSTPVLLDGLKKRGVKVTFFVIGSNAKKHPDIVKQEAQDGHIVGNHTYNHVEITKVSEEVARKEIMDTSKLVEEITGQPTQYMRPPFGAWQKELEMELEVMPVLWNVDPLDWTTENEDEIVNKVVTDVKENDIILLHDCYISSVNAALRIVDILQKKGYEFVTVEELIID